MSTKTMIKAGDIGQMIGKKTNVICHAALFIEGFPKPKKKGKINYYLKADVIAWIAQTPDTDAAIAHALRLRYQHMKSGSSAASNPLTELERMTRDFIIGKYAPKNETLQDHS